MPEISCSAMFNIFRFFSNDVVETHHSVTPTMAPRFPSPQKHNAGKILSSAVVSFSFSNIT